MKIIIVILLVATLFQSCTVLLLKTQKVKIEGVKTGQDVTANFHLGYQSSKDEIIDIFHADTTLKMRRGLDDITIEQENFLPIDTIFYSSKLNPIVFPSVLVATGAALGGVVVTNKAPNVVVAFSGILMTVAGAMTVPTEIFLARYPAGLRHRNSYSLNSPLVSKNDITAFKALDILPDYYDWASKLVFSENALAEPQKDKDEMGANQIIAHITITNNIIPIPDKRAFAYQPDVTVEYVFKNKENEVIASKSFYFNRGLYVDGDVLEKQAYRYTFNELIEIKHF